MKSCLLMLIAFCLALPAASTARTWYIRPDGTGDAPTIQAGIDSASAGDTVLVCCGTYHDCTHPDSGGVLNCVIMRSGICLRSETGQPDCATIDAQGLGRAVYCRSVSGGASIEGFTITGGDVVGAEYPYNQGGGILCDGSTIAIEGCAFISNTADYGGGMLCYESKTTLTNCTFVDNWSDDGGGLSGSSFSDISLSGCDFYGNHTADDGGGVLTRWYCYLTVTECRFSGNSAGRHGGGMYCGSNRLIEVSDCVFSDNHAELYGGGGLCCIATDPVVRNTIFCNNSTSQAGGGFKAEGQYCDVSILGCTFFGNHSGGGAVFAGDWATLHMDSSIVASSLGTTGVACGYFGSADLACCDLWANEGGDWTGCIADQYGINGNFSACPSFCHAESGDFHLCDESPCAPGNHPDGYDCGLIGACDVGCSCGPSQSEATTWGAVKAMYR